MFRCMLLSYFLLISTNAAMALDFYIQKPHDLPNSDYEAQLLRIALDHAPGNHQLFYAENPYTQGRLFRELAAGRTQINIIFSGYSRERESTTRMIYIPLTRGLLGNRMFLVSRKSSNLLSNLSTLEQLTRNISVGVGVTRPSEKILPAAGFTIVRSPGDQLVPMLIRGRFTSLLYGLDEIDARLEIANGYTGGDDIVINTDFLITFPFDSFFFVAPNDEERADIVETGLEKAYQSGAFMEHFKNFPPIKAGLTLVESHQPKVFEIDNPDISKKMKAIPSKYWHQFESRKN